MHGEPMDAEKWAAASLAERCAALRRGFPFDYLLTPGPFIKAAALDYEQLPPNAKAAMSS
jgi:hypothetical protein